MSLFTIGVKNEVEAIFAAVVIELILFTFILEILVIYKADIKEDVSYEYRRQECYQEIKDTQAQLDEIIKNYSDIKGYDYSKYLETMDYRELIETYLPELLEPTKTVRGYSETRPAGKLLDKIENIQYRLSWIEREHSNIDSKKWWVNFSK